MDVFLRGNPVHDHVGVEDDEQREEDRSGPGDAALDYLALEEQLDEGTKGNIFKVFRNTIQSRKNIPS